MRVLLTGANGFIGSHVLERLVQAGFDVSILLRDNSDTRFIEAMLPRTRVHYGSLESPGSLHDAVQDVHVVIHCAGKTKAVRKQEYYAVNVGGTRNLVRACNAVPRSLQQLILISSSAVSGPAPASSPAREYAQPRPVTDYGKSKMLAEQYVRRHSRVPFTILRPAAVYGPRDKDFRLAFKLARLGFLLHVDRGLRPLSLIYVEDVATAVLKAVGRSLCQGRIYHLAHPEPSTQKGFLLAIAEAMGVRPACLPMPRFALHSACLLCGLVSRFTSRPSILSADKVPELMAPGWVCSTERAAEELGFVAATSLEQGIRLSVQWYEDNGWL